MAKKFVTVTASNFPAVIAGLEKVFRAAETDEERDWIIAMVTRLTQQAQDALKNGTSNTKG